MGLPINGLAGALLYSNAAGFACLYLSCYVVIHSGPFNQCQLYHYRIIACLHRLTTQLCSANHKVFCRWQFCRVSVDSVCGSAAHWKLLLANTKVGIQSFFAPPANHYYADNPAEQWSTVGRQQRRVCFWCLVVVVVVVVVTSAGN